MRQITFELLRHGPSNNQLLSPLTQYLALCENHSAITVHVPFEHNQFLHRIRALSYQLGAESRAFQVNDSAKVLADVLAQVPGLVAELNRDPQSAEYVCGLNCKVSNGRRDPQPLTHLRLIISSSELALLPFELALAPPGFPGAGQSLLLQFQSPICLTREVRRVPEQYLEWPSEPRVLFVAASPSDVRPVPAEDHIRALKELLEPWVVSGDTEQEREQLLNKHLVVLQNATCQDIERACADGGFSHVHILAHGIQYEDGFDVRFGLALHNPADPTGNADRVSGERLAMALRPVQTSAAGPLARPVAVTLASCDSANQGTIAGMGGSLAHALHSAGIPMVVASQFPISIAGSLVFVKVLYKALLWGEDPRVALNDLRRRLAQYPTTHDWASVTAYVSLPPDFDRRMSDVQITQTMRSMEVAMIYADRATAKLMKPKPGTGSSTSITDDEKLSFLKGAQQRMDEGRARLERLVERSDNKARVFGLLAATEKRCAEVYFSFSRSKSQVQYTEQWLGLLQQSRQHYWDAFLADRANSWAVVQYLSLDLLLRRLKTPAPNLRIERHEEHNNPLALWNLGHVSSINDLRAKDERLVHWALANLIELYLIAPLIGPPKASTAPAADMGNAQTPEPPESTEIYKNKALQRTQDLIDRAGPEAFEVYSTRRQLLRYDDWYSEIAEIDLIHPAVSAIVEILPKPKQNPHQ
jgi:hypothetical protein